MMMFEIPFKNKITITGVVYSDSNIDASGITSFPIRTCRPKVSEDEFTLLDNVMIDSYMIYSRDTEPYKTGDIVTITGTAIIVRSREKLICPICGKTCNEVPNPRFSILADVILKKEIGVASNYHKALKYLEKTTNENNWNNIIEIKEIETTPRKSNNKKLGDFTSYRINEEIMMSAAYKIPDIKLMPDMYKGTYSFVGNLALVNNYYDSFNCKYCDSFVKIENKLPWVFCIEEPGAERTSVFDE